ncbi:CAP domain-containing protein [Tenacibaculum sp. MEBiC06402]|uniref:CAP domain-containing protein n=1 Tax=unclassified Tenacibaculum TaxID=2635139 RepID=UPI003B9A4AF9
MKYLQPILILSLIFIITSCSSDSDNAGIIDDTSNSSSYEKDILELINNHRNSKGLPYLKVLNIIKTQTDNHTDYMIADGKISHDNFSSRSNYLQTNAQAKATAENVASGYSSASSVVNGWLNSDGHRKNIEGNYTHFHLTAKQSSNNKWYYTNIFIRK